MVMEVVVLVDVAFWFGLVPRTYVITEDAMVFWAT